MSKPSDGFIVSISFELCLFAFHLSVFACILRNRWKGNAIFSTGFFTIYIMESVADYTDHSLNILFIRLATNGYPAKELFEYPRGNLLNCILSYACHFQFVSHAAIAVNRFLALTDAWNTRKQRATIIISLLLPLPAAALRLVGSVRLFETSAPGLYAVALEPSWVGMAGLLTITVYSLATGIVSFVFELRSLAAYRRLTSSAKIKYHNDFLLLAYALLQFIIQAVIIIFFSLSTYGALIGDRQLSAIGYIAGAYIGIALCFSPPICLILTSSVVRKAWFEMYLPLACTTGTKPPTSVSPMSHASKPARRLW